MTLYTVNNVDEVSIMYATDTIDTPKLYLSTCDSVWLVLECNMPPASCMYPTYCSIAVVAVRRRCDIICTSATGNTGINHIRFFSYWIRKSKTTGVRLLLACPKDGRVSTPALTRAGPEVFEHSPLTRLLGHVATRGKRHSNDRQKTLRNYCGHLIGKVKGQVARGNRRSNLALFNVFRQFDA